MPSFGQFCPVTGSGVAFLPEPFRGGRRSKSRPNEPCGGPRMNPSVDVGNPPRPFRHLRVAKHCTPDRYCSSRAPVHSVLVQKSVTTITNSVGQLSTWMLGNSRQIRKRLDVKSWQLTCPHHLGGGIVLPSAPAIIEHFIESIRQMLRPLAIIQRSSVELALHQMELISNVERG
jgi:hypothetical protein